MVHDCNQPLHSLFCYLIVREIEDLQSLMDSSTLYKYISHHPNSSIPDSIAFNIHLNHITDQQPFK